MNKLVRDKIAANIEKRKGRVTSKTLTEKQFYQHIKIKLQEELDELVELDFANREANINEISDLLLLLAHLQKILNISPKEIAQKQAKKIAKAGAFDKRIYRNRGFKG